jgi:hypothetical protein
MSRYPLAGLTPFPDEDGYYGQDLEDEILPYYHHVRRSRRHVAERYAPYTGLADSSGYPLTRSAVGNPVVRSALNPPPPALPTGPINTGDAQMPGVHNPVVVAPAAAIVPNLPAMVAPTVVAVPNPPVVVPNPQPLPRRLLRSFRGPLAAVPKPPVVAAPVHGSPLDYILHVTNYDVSSLDWTGLPVQANSNALDWTLISPDWAHLANALGVRLLHGPGRRATSALRRPADQKHAE